MFLNRKIKNKQKIIILICFFILSVLSILPLLKSNYYPNGSNDLDFHLIRIAGLAENIKIGNFPTYINFLQLQGFGYPVDIFYPYTFLIIPALLYLKSVPMVLIIKGLFFFVTLITLLSSYYSANSILKNEIASFFSAVFFTFSSYRIYDFYMRGGIGSTFSFIFLPITFLGIYEILYRDERKFYLLVIGYSGILLSHFLTALITFIFLFIIVIFNLKKLFFQEKFIRLKKLMLAGISVVVLTAFYLLPLFEQMLSYTSFVNVSSIVNIDETAAGLMDMIATSINNSATLPSLGLLIFSAPLLLLTLKIKKLKIPSVILGSAYIGVFIFFASTNLFPWRLLRPILGVIQYPARLLIFSSIFLSLVGGYCISILINNSKYKIRTLTLFMFLIFSLIFSQLYSYRNEENPHPLVNGDFIIDQTTIGVGKEYLPAETDVDFILKNNKISTSNKTASISNVTRSGLTIEATIKTASTTDITFPLIYYKGYQAVEIKSDGSEKILPISIDKNHLITTKINQNSNLRIYYKGTMIQKISSLISLISIVIFLVFLYNNKKNMSGEDHFPSH
ncbi:hypothetical protein CYV26_01370 [Carnobacterium maltaromaticum]|uniref:hypothetical protein n=1 Tax=Carnobacterium maltaromaticum TaxID=2751 RepID=UPI000C779ADE|nr:hypothetical protein [Carnobacterium maltaromaticum]PLS36923.1 hypothetical protein CYV33_05145 [Carnobacterium maltaromaticum]PLS37738.1 hypothetical protein CYV30_05140 [Carnobacterium maltaromaticum]PLS39679.1 hypothetical protein CYV31_03125 [Carnobacterium maltaromaticum]PLS44435.1 hypothetical protein CYV28_05140 [Carnobacterium maltaromaticum]PLS46469.1 hypothetical protein CYV27_05135 [Carnobacterium maltaromaticum]